MQGPAVETPIGKIAGNIEWYYVSLETEGTKGEIPDFDLSIYETRESTFTNRETDEVMTSTWLVGLK